MSSTFDAAGPEWADLVPIPQDDGSNPVCPILYSQPYASGMSLLRALLALSPPEYSARALDLTSHLLLINPSSYTVWAYRAQILANAPEGPAPAGLGPKEDRLREEFEWLDGLSEKVSLKNYQIWQHRKQLLHLIPSLSSAYTTYPSVHSELEFTSKILEKDAKNYHTWSHRSWLLCASAAASASAPAAASSSSQPPRDLWLDELHYTTRLIEEDARNNSAWNMRWTAVVGRKKREDVTAKEIEDEIAFTKQSISRVPHNASAWNYLRGLASLKSATNPCGAHVDFAQEIVARPPTAAGHEEDENGEARAVPPENARALEWLFDDACARSSKAEVDALHRRLLLAEPMRRRYWMYRMLNSTPAAQAA